MATQSDQDWQSTKNTVLERNCYMFNNPLMSDITFTCGESKRKYFYAHKYVLATSSAVFYAMFYGDLAETNSVVHLPDANEENLEEFLRFLYTDECRVTPDSAAKLLYLAKKYMITSLNEKCVKTIGDNLHPDNVITNLDQAINFDEKELVKKCWELVDLYTLTTIESKDFLDITKDTLMALLKRDTIKVGELDLFQAVMKWSDNQCILNELDMTLESRRLLLGDLVYQLRFLLMSEVEFTEHVVPAGLLTEQEVAPIMEKFGGLDPNGLQWPLVKQRLYFIRANCARVSEKTSRQGWAKDWTSWISRKVDDDRGTNWRFRIWNTSYLRFKVDTPVMLHGLRLLGDADESEYEVAVEIEGVDCSTMNGKYTSSFDELSATYGFDVMLPTPVAVKPREFIGISVSVREPQSYYVVNKLENTKVGGINVHFDHQYTKRGDIAEIILRLMTHE